MNTIVCSSIVVKFGQSRAWTCPRQWGAVFVSCVIGSACPRKNSPLGQTSTGTTSVAWSGANEISVSGRWAGWPQR